MHLGGEPVLRNRLGSVRQRGKSAQHIVKDYSMCCMYLHVSNALLCVHPVGLLNCVALGVPDCHKVPAHSSSRGFLGVRRTNINVETPKECTHSTLFWRLVCPQVNALR